MMKVTRNKLAREMLSIHAQQHGTDDVYDQLLAANGDPDAVEQILGMGLRFKCSMCSRPVAKAVTHNGAYICENCVQECLKLCE